MKTVYPRDGHQTHEASTFVMGSVAPGNLLRMNDKSVAVTPEGFFTETVALEPGENGLILAEFDADQKLLDEIRLQVTRLGDVAPVAEGQAEVLVPAAQGCVAVQPGGHFSLVVRVSPCVQAVSVVLPSLLPEPVPLVRCGNDGHWDNRENLFAQLHQTEALVPATSCFEGTVTLPSGLVEGSDTLNLLCFDVDGEQRTLPTLLLVTVWPSCRWGTVAGAIPEVGGDRVIVRSGPSGNASRLTPLLSGSRIKVSAQQGAWYQVHYTQTQTGWIHQDNLHFEEAIGVFPQPLRLVQFSAEGKRQIRLTLPLSMPVPVGIVAGDNQLEVTLHGVSWHTDVVRLPQGAVVTGFAWQSIDAETVKLTITVPRLCGVDYGYSDGSFWVTVKTRPRRLEEMVVLVDPGHGGREPGSIGPDGLPEKALNLTVANRLGEALANAGVQRVTFTRTEDVGVSLSERHQAAVGSTADVVLSIHHNALPDGRNPENYRGAGIYYYHSYALSLASAMYRAFCEAGVESDGIVYDSLALTRIGQAASLLLELGYFTNPQDYAQLVSPAYQQILAAAMVKGLSRWVQED